MDDSYVRIMLCGFCGKQTNALALHKRLKPIKQDVFDTQPCDECKERFKTFKYFIGDCGHSGFIKKEALERVIDSGTFTELENTPIFRMEKCFACLNIVQLQDCPTI